MKIQNKKSAFYKRKIFTFIGIFVLALAGIVTAAFKYNIIKIGADNYKNVNAPALTTDQKKQDTNSSATSSNENKPTDSSPSQNKDGLIQITLSALGQDTKAGPIIVRSILSGATGGSCNYTAVGPSVTKNYTSNVSFSGSYYSCNYDIPYSDLSAGRWKITLDVTQSNKNGTVSRDLSVE